MNKASPKTPLVLLSGLLCDRFMWQTIADQLGDIADITIFSFAGFNSISEMADHVLANSPGHFALAGHSMGGRVALEVIAKAASRVNQLALLNTGVHPRREAEVPGRQRLLDLSINKGMAAVADTWLAPMMSPTGLANSALMQQLKQMVLRHTAQDFDGQIQALLTRPNAEAVLPFIQVPTLLMSGTEDKWSPISQHKEIQKHISGSQLVTLEGAGHMSTVETPEAISRAFRQWLTTPTETKI